MHRNFGKILSVALLFLLLGSLPAMAVTKLNFAGIMPLDAASSKAALEVIKIVEKETKGEVQIKFFPAGQLGDYVLVYEELMKGTIDMAVIPLVSQFDPKFALCSVAFLAKDYKDAKKLFGQGGFIFKKTGELNRAKGVQFFGFNIDGFGGLGLVKEPVDILNPKVNKKVLVRTSPNDILKYTLESMQYRPITIPYSDLYTAMQTGVCEGWIGGSAEANYISFRDVIKYYHELNLYVEALSFLVSDKTWTQKLTPEQRKIIEKAFLTVSDKSFAAAEKANKEYRDKMRAAGVKVYEYTDKQLEPLIVNGREYVWKKLDSVLGKELIDELFKAVGN